jgi:hypothetical protein
MDQYLQKYRGNCCTDRTLGVMGHRYNDVQQDFEQVYLFAPSLHNISFRTAFL